MIGLAARLDHDVDDLWTLVKKYDAEEDEQ
jgi:hypothetical protein